MLPTALCLSPIVYSSRRLFAVLSIDLAHLKLRNDRWGRLVGSCPLKGVHHGR